MYLGLYIEKQFKRGRRFEREKDGVYGRLWREAMKGSNDVIILL